MKILFKIINLQSKLITIIYTILVKGAFFSFGKNSLIRTGALINYPNMISIGSNVRISQFVWLNASEDLGNGSPSLHIGDGTYIGRLVHINAWRSVQIGSNVLISDRVHISDATHIYKDKLLPISKQGTEFSGPVCIGDGSWIGAGAAILPGVTIGKNAIVGANAVVTKNVLDGQIVAGVPAIAIN